jgi:hypothetical protein
MSLLGHAPHPIIIRDKRESCAEDNSHENKTGETPMICTKYRARTNYLEQEQIVKVIKPKSNSVKLT